MTPPPSEPSRLRRIGRMTVRLTLIGAVLWAGWTIVASWSLLLGEPQAAKHLPAELHELEAALPVELLAAAPPGFSWQFVTPLKPGGKLLPPLLALPAGTDRVCLQGDKAGVVRAEIWSTTRTPAELAAHWQSTGWQVKDGRLSADGSTSLVCSKDAETVRVWAGPYNEETKQRVLFLVRGETGGKGS
jgi:hypothetical protein